MRELRMDRLNLLNGEELRQDADIVLGEVHPSCADDGWSGAVMDKS